MNSFRPKLDSKVLLVSNAASPPRGTSLWTQYREDRTLDLLVLRLVGRHSNYCANAAHYHRMELKQAADYLESKLLKSFDRQRSDEKIKLKTRLKRFDQ